MACDANELLSEGKCFQCLSTGQALIAELQLLCLIYEASGGGGSQEVFFGAGSPEGVVTHDGPAIYYTAAGGLWVAVSGDGGNTGWEERIADAP